MLSWIFRNRERLMIVYGSVAPPPLAGRRFAAGPERTEAHGREPGRIVRRRRWTVVVPLRRPFGAACARGTHVFAPLPFDFTPDS